MEIVSCARCAETQPPDWRPGDVCVHCGAVARPESRCPWCQEMAPGRFCRHCGCELVHPADYGTARMLFAAGVDRLSMGDRLRDLDPAQREVLASRFSAQRARVAARVEEARACEAQLSTAGWAAHLEEELLCALPVADDTPWLGPALRDRIPPEALFATTALLPLRQLAALAAVRAGTRDREILNAVLYLAESDQPMAVEAALAISGWRARRAASVRSDPRGRRHAHLRDALAEPNLGAEAAVCVALDLLTNRWRARLDPADLEPLLPQVREAMQSANADVQLGAALVLGDDHRLGRAVDQQADDELREAALAALARVQSALVPGLLARDPALRQRLLTLLPVPLTDPVLAAVLEVLAGDDEAARGRAATLVRRERFLHLKVASRERIAAWIASHPEALTVKEAQEFLDWAQTKVDGQRASSAALRPFVEAVTRVLRAGAVCAEWADHQVLGPWLSEVATDADREVLDRLVAAPETCAGVLVTVLYLRGRAASEDPVATAHLLDLLLGIWDRSGASRARWIPTLADLIRQNRGLRGMDDLIPPFWARFLARPDERAPIMRALEAFRRELYLVRDAQPPEEAIDGGDPVRFFELWAAAVPDDLVAVFDAARERGGPEDLHEIARAALAVVTAAVPRSAVAALLLLGHVSSTVGNAFRREREREPGDAICGTVAVVRETWAAVEPAILEAHPDPAWQTKHGYLLARVRDELEIIDRHEREAAERNAEIAKREAERQRREAEKEAQRAADERAAHQRQQAEREKHVRVQRQVEHDRVHLQPDLVPAPLDDEAVCAEPIPTLRDYARVIKQLSAGGDVMALLAAYGLDPAGWSACVTGWQQVLTTRQDLMLRFGALMQASWTD